MILYSKNGKEIPIFNGCVIQPGSLLYVGGEWKTLDKKHVIRVRREDIPYDQGKETFTELVPVEEK